MLEKDSFELDMPGMCTKTARGVQQERLGRTMIKSVMQHCGTCKRNDYAPWAMPQPSKYLVTLAVATRLRFEARQEATQYIIFPGACCVFYNSPHDRKRRIRRLLGVSKINMT